MSDDGLNRRDFMKLVGAGAASAALPMMPSILGAESDGPPQRLIVIFTANGTIRDRWRPEGQGANWSIPDDSILTPLRDFKDDMLVVDGLDMRSTKEGPGGGHQKGIGHLLTGRPLLENDTFEDAGGDPVGWAAGKSVDQYIADRVHSGERFQSINFAVQAGRPLVKARMSYRDAAKPVEPNQDPFNAFDRLFASVVQNQKKMERLRARRKSVLDELGEDLQRVQKQASADDKKRLQQHLASIRDMERRLNTGNEEGIACKAPDRGGRFDPQKGENFPETGQLMMDMIVSSLSCRLTRVATLQWNRSVGPIRPSWLGIHEKHHKMSHEDEKYEEELVELNRWFAEQFAYLLRGLDAVDEPDGEGTLLDNTLVFWGNELGDGSKHSRENMPFVLAGGGGDHFKTGEYIQVDKPHNDLLVSLCNAMGVSTQTFGDQRFCNGPLSEVTV